MNPNGSVTGWIAQLKAGRSQALQSVWERYFARLVTLARRRLQIARRGVADEEDVALSAFASFFRGAEAGRFPQLDDRHDLWRLLVVITERKALNLARDQRRLKRGGGRQIVSGSGGPSLADVQGREPTPAFAALVADQCRCLLESLGDHGLQTLALLKMEGYGNVEISQKQGWALRTVERKLRVIREIWQQSGVE